MSFGISVRNGVSIGLLASTTLASRVARLAPRLELNFLAGTTLDSRITFTRSTTATFVGSNGLIQTAAINTPRFDYDPITLAAKGLLIEEQRVNLALRSEDFGDVAWSKSGASVTTNVIAAPDGATTADKLIEDTSTGVHAVSQFAPIASTAYAFSVFAKAGERTKLQFNGGGFTGLGFVAIFDLSNGTMTTNTGSRAFITPFGNGWYRCSVSFTTSNTSTISWLMVDETNNSSYTGNGTSGLYLWGAQYETGIFTTSYIPTGAATVTRAVDAAVMTGTNFSSWYNQSEGTFISSSDTAKPSGSGSSSNVHSANDNTTSNVVSLRFVTSNLSGLVQVGGSAQTAFVGTVYVANTPIKGGIAYKLNDTALSISGNAPVVDALVTIGTAITQMNIGSRNGSIEPLNGHVRFISYYPTRLSNAQLQQLTA